MCYQAETVKNRKAKLQKTKGQFSHGPNKRMLYRPALHTNGHLPLALFNERCVTFSLSDFRKPAGCYIQRHPQSHDHNEGCDNHGPDEGGPMQEQEATLHMHSVALGLPQTCYSAG